MTLQLDALPLTDIVTQLPSASSSQQLGWFPLFQLQRNATLLLTNLTAYVNPADTSQARPTLHKCSDEHLLLAGTGQSMASSTSCLIGCSGGLRAAGVSSGCMSKRGRPEQCPDSPACMAGLGPSTLRVQHEPDRRFSCGRGGVCPAATGAAPALHPAPLHATQYAVCNPCCQTPLSKTVSRS